MFGFGRIRVGLGETKVWYLPNFVLSLARHLNAIYKKTNKQQIRNTKKTQKDKQNETIRKHKGNQIKIKLDTKLNIKRTQHQLEKE